MTIKDVMNVVIKFLDFSGKLFLSLPLKWFTCFAFMSVNSMKKLAPASNY